MSLCQIHASNNFEGGRSSVGLSLFCISFEGWETLGLYFFGINYVENTHRSLAVAVPDAPTPLRARS